MTENNKPISPLRQRMIDDMSLRKLSPKTQRGYIRAVLNFTRFLSVPLTKRVPRTCGVSSCIGFRPASLGPP